MGEDDYSLRILEAEYCLSFSLYLSSPSVFSLPNTHKRINKSSNLDRGRREGGRRKREQRKREGGREDEIVNKSWRVRLEVEEWR